ncbi:chemerin-like receptor 1 [Hypanus sabinus]|uniref:chemerin-like receptor 1 n=1 Tax=Hypanus sabinus TaxID=79690 RepID=UPI0028C3E339|nr:chemerin-like receptor 1 [Hypanus sabinus]XP_059813454.1 chemerin-like receptor 1 [Hypanus sabinus]XP_059813455.1 chemerin-like receptor 1 [Hypanus sabinus]XP_059813457.1 chemerin-like receptor 1 [Hypanus sabinus]XP_059813458.1 chemerin-like receptor 1 [Hypanus sabinus]XP_059813459.1 chemerin-like receptor 1 [Hypanus sabinus]XP_059813460.1 chemerin-like receptor 1 [Hypanus sabinus]
MTEVPVSHNEPASDCIPPLSIFTIIVCVLTCILGLLGNGLVIYVSTRELKVTVNTVWFLSLAVADFTFTLLLPFYITSLTMSHHWPFGRFFCKTHSFLAVLTMYASAFTVTLVSLDRCCSILWPVWSQNHRRLPLARRVSLLAWVAATALAVPTWTYRDVVTVNGTVSCHMNMWHTHEETRLDEAYESDILYYDVYDELKVVRSSRQVGLVVSQVVLGFFIPFLIIAISYTLVGLQVRIHGRPGRNKPYKIMATVVLAFVLCLLPLQVFKLLELVWSEYLPHNFLRLGMPLASALAFFNSCLNPILYFTMGRRIHIGLEVKTALRVALGEESASSRYSRRDSRSTSLVREASVTV